MYRKNTCKYCKAVVTTDLLSGVLRKLKSIFLFTFFLMTEFPFLGELFL